MVNAGEVAASTVLGAFALLTARNSLSQRGKVLTDNKDDLETLGSLSSKSTLSEANLANKDTKLGQYTEASSSINKKVLSGYDLVTEIAKSSSEKVFTFLGETQKNVVKLEAVQGSVDIILGAASEQKNVSIVTSSEVLFHNIEAFQEFGTKNIPSVWHIGCNSVDAETLKLYSDFSFLKLINMPALVASTAQEVAEFGLIAHYVSNELNIPISNVFDGVSALNQQTSISSKVYNTPKLDLTSKLSKAIEKASNSLLKRQFTAYSYHGPLDADIVFVCFGSISPVLLRLSEKIENIGILTVKLLMPFDAVEFLKVIPPTTKRVCVVEYTPSNVTVLFQDIAAALWNSELQVDAFCTRINSKELDVVDQSVASMVVTNATAKEVDRELVITAQEAANFESKLTLLSASSTYGSLLGFSQVGSVFTSQLAVVEFTLWEDDNNSFDLEALRSYQSRQITERVDTIQGVKRLDVKLSRTKQALFDYDQFGFGKINLSIAAIESKFLFLAAQSVGQNGKLLLVGEESYFNIQNLSNDVKRYIFTNNIPVFYMQRAADVTEYLKEAKYEEIDQIAFRFSGKETKESAPVFINRRRPRPTRFEQQLSEKLESYKLAWNVIFKDAYKTKEALKPSEHGVSIAKVVKFERLTPDEYNRNIFHIEFDISGTGLTYQIGDALGVFGENDEQKVDEFIKAYGLDADEIVVLPSRGEMKDGKVEYTSIRNLLTKKLDLFGKVPKRFYVDLAAFATSRYEKLKLLHTGTDDAELFKLGTWETVTPAELLLQYKSCKLDIYDMIKIIPEIKARHYSISSSMKMSPTSVHLLVVAVDWVTPLGKKGEGQCTRFLKNLKIGQRVCVDIQQSVLRLPPNPEQPIVMAGLGTGMAPFRAFVQQRYFLKRMGVKIGPMVLYFGARHKAQEWLYGEELEKYEKMGLLRLGLAWSRDQKNKVYIQHKIQEDSALLKKYLKDMNGYFYLCGPTWPVPDVRDAINSGLEDENAVAELKESGRYILEVY